MDTAERIAKNEGYRRNKYLDSEGIETIGFGFNLEQGFDVTESRMILNYRIEKIKNQLTFKLDYFITFPSEVQSVLVEMAYNLGVHGVLQFCKTINYLIAEDYEKASIEMLDSKWADQVGDRAVRLSEIIRNV